MYRSSIFLDMQQCMKASDRRMNSAFRQDAGKLQAWRWIVGVRVRKGCRSWTAGVRVRKGCRSWTAGVNVRKGCGSWTAGMKVRKG